MVELGSYYFSQLQFNQAIPILRKTLSITKDSNGARMLLALSYLEQRGLVNARKQINILKKKAVLKYRKQQATALELFVKGEYRKSLELLKITLKSNRDNDAAYYLIANAYLNLNKPKNARIYLTKIDPQGMFKHAAQFRLVLANLKMGDSTIAMQKLTGLYAELPDTRHISYRVALLAYKKKNYDIATVAVENANQGDREIKKYLLLQARILWRKGEIENAIVYLKDIQSKFPRYKPVLYRLADYLDQSGSSEQAMAYFDQLAEIDRDYSDVLFRIARLHYGNNARLLVTALLEEFLQTQSSNLDARLLYATNYCDSSQFTECKKQLDIVLRFDAENQRALDLKKSFSLISSEHRLVNVT